MVAEFGNGTRPSIDLPSVVQNFCLECAVKTKRSSTRLAATRSQSSKMFVSIGKCWNRFTIQERIHNIPIVGLH